MSKQAMVDLTIQVPEADLTILRETLRLSRQRQKDPVKFFQSKAFDGCVSLASSTVTTDRWAYLQAFARELGVESPV
jgi:hypothetical protein